MALTKSKKQEVLGSLAEIIKGAKTLVFVKFDKLSVFNSNALRRELRQNDSGLRVAKKRLLLRALDEGGFKGEVPTIEGEVMLDYSADDLAPAQKVCEECLLMLLIHQFKDLLLRFLKLQKSKAK